MRGVGSKCSSDRYGFEKPAKRWHPNVSKLCGRNMPRLLKRNARQVWTVILLLAIGSPDAWAEETVGNDDVSPGQMGSGSLLLRMQSGYEVATRMNTHIDARISGIVARVSVKQSFRNSGQEWVEGVYVFPLPDSAAVDRLRMHIGERFIEGEIREKEQAKKEYEKARAAGKKAGLVEQQRANLFTTSVANVAPGEIVTVEIEYLETLRYEDESFSLRFPITLTPRYIPGLPLQDRSGSGWSADTDQVPDASLITPPVVVDSSEHRVTFHAEINAGVPLELIASRYHPVKIDAAGDGYTVDLAGPNVPMDHDLELTWRPVPSAAPRAMIFTEVIDDQPHMLLMMLPPNQEVAATAEAPRELIFVIDTSGSMHGTSLEQAKRALTLAIDGLNPVDRFNVIQFNSVTAALFPAAVDANSNNVGIAKRFVAGLVANGGTEMRPAIQQALSAKASEAHLKQVIFITDGSVGNEQELFRLIEQQLGNTRFFTVGIGSAPNSWFMRKAAEAGRGTFTFISALHEVSEKMGRLFRKLEQPQVTDVTLQWPHGQEPLAYPQNIPDLYAGEPVLVKARMNNQMLPGDIISIRGQSAAGTWGAELSADLQEQNVGVAALWARARIEDLLDRQSRGADPTETRDAVVETALAHHLVSKFTSLVAVDKTPVRPAASALNKEQVPNLLPYGQSPAAIFGFPATATPAGFYRASGLTLIALGILGTLLLLILGPGSRPRELVQAA